MCQYRNFCSLVSVLSHWQLLQSLLSADCVIHKLSLIDYVIVIIMIIKRVLLDVKHEDIESAVAQWLECLSCNTKVVASTPTHAIA